MSQSLVPAYELLASDIHALGIECVFGLMSDDTAQFITTLDAMGVRFYAARHENNAVAMAEGYASATGGLAIAIIGRGPAAANAMHGTTYVQRSGSKVLVIFGDGPIAAPAANGVGPDRKSFNTLAALQATGLRTFVASDASSCRQVLAQAVSAAHGGPTGLLLPTNVQLGRIDPEATVAASALPPPYVPAPARDMAIQAAAALLEKSRKPLFLVGWGAHCAGARDDIVRLADHVGAALITTVKGRDMFRGHPFDCGILGSFSNAGGRRLVEQADCVVAIGAGLNQQTTSYGAALPPGVPVIQVDNMRTNIGRWFPADVAVVGDARLAVQQLLEAVPPRPASAMAMRSEENARWLAGFDLAQDFQPMNTPRTLDHRSVALELDRMLPADRNTVYDNGNFAVMIPYLRVAGPAHYRQASDFASIGVGFGTAMGFAAGTPDRTTVLLLGDGSFLMTMGELETVAREGIPLVIVLMNDCSYGAELHFLKERDMAVGLSLFPDIDFAPVAEAFGFQAATVRTLDELQALAPLLANPEGPVFIDCKVNQNVCAPFLLESSALATRKA